jgi:hypothetical protein
MLSRFMTCFALFALSACADEPESEPAPTHDAALGAATSSDGGGSASPTSGATPLDGATSPPTRTDASQTGPRPTPDAGGAGARLDAGTRDAGASVDGGLDAGRDAGRDSGPSQDPSFTPLSGGCQGWSSRYWDCCKPHCGWRGNVSGGAALASCGEADQSIGVNDSVMSSCQGGTAYMCHALAPWAVDADLSYGFAAIAARGDICGKCYQLQFSGRSHNAGDDPGSAALAGKTMIIQATNVGGDVGNGQFDLLIPGGGVGAFNACSAQWGVSSGELGAQYGGFLASCKQQGARDHAAIKSCVMQRCTSVFGNRGLSELEAGCRWFVEWFQAADNPALLYKEVTCPQELKTRGMNRNTSPANSCGV